MSVTSYAIGCTVSGLAGICVGLVLGAVIATKPAPLPESVWTPLEVPKEMGTRCWLVEYERRLGRDTSLVCKGAEVQP